MPGFERLSLTPAENWLLLAFDAYGELALPYHALRGLLSKQRVSEALKSLIDKQLVINGTPYRLTKKGKRVAAQLSSIAYAEPDSSGETRTDQ